MKMEGLILDESDIIQETKTKYGTGEQFTIGKIHLITTYPTDKIEVTVPTELWENGKAGALLKQLVGKRTTFNVQYKDNKFGNDDGKMVQITGFHLFNLPDVNNK
ncbi:chemotaxis protein [Vibrio sp. A8-1]|uniref:chemotaxis protein n=1 Tax=Vibrio TaxID=662 RepID=UPI0014838429|nr:chemotaxis protein [Vibrio sp. A8-1]NNN83893.1 chemotaxis protein [Vibrio sp. A8-1]